MSTPLYQLRYFFNFGAGVCLWAGNDATREIFDYPVSSAQLPITTTLKYRVEFVVTWYDTFLDWDCAPQLTPWSDREQAQFNAAAQELLHLLREQLAEKFVIVDESGTAL